MTRGKFVLIGNHRLFVSCEFNGDMYPEGHGRLAKELLERVETTQQFYEMVAYFNRTNHNYTDEYPLVYVEDLKLLEDNSDFNGDKYFDYWFSDWLFIKNLSSKASEFTIRGNKEKVQIEPNSLLIVNFGKLPSQKDLKILDWEGVKKNG